MNTLLRNAPFLLRLLILERKKFKGIDDFIVKTQTKYAKISSQKKYICSDLKIPLAHPNSTQCKKQVNSIFPPNILTFFNFSPPTFKISLLEFSTYNFMRLHK